MILSLLRNGSSLKRLIYYFKLIYPVFMFYCRLSLYDIMAVLMLCVTFFDASSFIYQFFHFNLYLGFLLSVSFVCAVNIFVSRTIVFLFISCCLASYIFYLI